MIPDHVLLDIGSWPPDPGVNTGSVKHDMALPKPCNEGDKTQKGGMDAKSSPASKRITEI